ncbi:MAG TPA: preprotein translocase subunit YajC [Actinomycetota bacterium]|nr:preprotein translocase subunit YajC [Actinomycetota bacterium]
MLGQLVFLVLIFVTFWLILWRPNQKRQQQHRQMIENVGPGDEIITFGGIYATVRSIAEDYLEVEIAPGTTIRIMKSAIRQVVQDDELEMGATEDDESDELEETGT